MTANLTEGDIRSKILSICPTFEKVLVRLVGENGNAYAIMDRVSGALRRAGYSNLTKLYTELATAGDYNNLLFVSMQFSDEPDECDEDMEDEYDG